MTLEVEINKVASHIAELAQGGRSKEVPFSEKVEALKTLATWYAILTKHKGKQSEGDSGPTFESFTKELEKTNGEAAVGSHRERRRLPAPFGN